jgi:PAS domain S-box-containing protein
MPPRLSFLGRPALGQRIAVLVLLACLGLTLWGWQHTRALMRHEARNYFELRVGEVQEIIAQRMRAYHQVLRGGAAFVIASKEVGREEWRAYFQRLRLAENYPGIQGFGWTVYLEPEEVPALEQRVRAEGFEQFRVWPEGERDIYTSILYLEPFDWRNQRAFGFDMYSEPVRRQAMARARDQGAAAASGRVTLVQEAGEQVQPGFLMYLPVFEDGTTPETVEARRRQLVGFVYSPFRMHDLMQGILGRRVPDLLLRVHDGGEIDPQSLLYSSGELPTNRSPAFRATTTLELYGHRWTLQIFSQPRMEEYLLGDDQPWLILAGGGLISLLLFGILWSMATLHRRALTLAQTMTEAFQRSEAKYSSLAQAATDAIIITDRPGRIVSWNRGATKMFGYEEQDVLGQPWTVILPPRLRQRYWRDLGAVVTEAAPAMLDRVLALTGQRQSGEEFPLELALARWGTGEELYVSGIIRDVTERTRVEQALKLSEARFRATFKHAAIGIVVSDKDDNIVEVNPRFAQLLGYKPDELLGHPALQYVHPDDRVAAESPIAVLTQGRRRDFKRQERYLRRDGSTLWASLTASLVRDESGEPLLLVRMIEDITDLKAAEAALARSYRELERRVEERTAELKEQTRELERSNAELEQFAYIASHDLQEPLRSVSAFAQLLERRHGDRIGEEGRQFIRFIVDGTGRMRELIVDLLTFSRVGSPQKQFEVVAADEVLRDALANLSGAIKERGAQVSADPLPSVWGNGSDLVQLFQNLIGNGIKFNRSDAPQVHVHVREQGGEWLFSVTDNGIGIAPDAHQRIFSIFQRGVRADEYSGTGVGLAICKKVVEHHGGRIWLESEPGRGTVFYFTLQKPPAA